MAYIGREPTNSGQFLLIDDISSQFNGSKQSFTLQVGGNDITPAKENIIVAIDGVLQEATSAYSVSGSTITFTGSPASDASFYGVLTGESQFIANNSISDDNIIPTANISGSKINTNFGAQTVTANQFGGNVSGSSTSTGSFGRVKADGGVVVDDITIDGTEIDLSSGDLTVDVEGDIILDANGADIKLKDDGTEFGRLSRVSSDLVIKSISNNNDILFKGVDGSSTITALQLDMSEAGNAIFNNDVTIAGTLTAQEIHTEFESASILFTSGSTRFGDDTTDTHRVTGSMDVSGSLDIPHGNLSVIDRVGVGTNNPTVALEVFGSADQQIRIDSTGNRAQLQFDGKKTSDAEFAEINFANDGDSAAAIHAMRDGANDAARLAFFTQPTGGSVTERMSIDSGGNVGIGTTNPTKLLDLESSGTEASVDFTNDTKTYRIGISDFGAGDDRLFFTDATKDITRMSITNEGSTLLSGSLQIESDLDTPLTIKKTSNGEMFIRFMNASGAMKGALIYRTDSNQFSLRTDNTTAFSIDSSQLVSFNGDIELNGSGTRQIRFDDGDESEGAIVFDEIADGFIFKVGGSGGTSKTDALKIQNNGNVVIGRNDATTISAAEIAADDDSVLGLIIKNANTGNGSGGMLKFSNGNGNNLTAIGSVQDGSTSASMLFFTETGGSFAERMRVDHTGAVGIGTNGPASKLHVEDANSNAPILTLEMTGGGGKIVAFVTNNTENGDISEAAGTVSLNGFQGAHQTNIAGSSDTTIKEGTVISTTDNLYKLNHPQCKISDTENDTRVYGVLSRYVSGSSDFVVASVGVGAIRVTGSCAGGDLLVSAGDGCAKVNNSATLQTVIGKVTSNTSGSATEDRLIPCVLYCG